MGKKQRKDNSVSSGLVTITTNLARSEVKEVTLNGRPHLSAPVMMIKAPIVMNGLLYPVDEVQKFVEAWNGRPVTLFHPKSAEGEYISANSPEVVDSVQLGQIFGAEFNDGLRAEAWVDVEKVKAVRPEVLDFYEGRRQNLEVSTGLFGDVVRVAGDLNGVAYDGIMTNIRPDHLALLPGGEGACSWSDGCGLRANEGEDVDKVIEFLKNQYLQANASTLKGIMEAMRKAVDGMDDRNYVHYFRDATVGRNAYVIYTKEKRWVEGQPPEPPKTYRQTYETDSNGVVILTGMPEEVTIQTTYVTVSEKKGDTTMNEKEKKQKVDALIACQRCRCAEKDREFLMSLNEEQLDLIAPSENVVVLVANDLKPEESILVQDGNVIVNAPKPKKDEAKADYMRRCKGMSGMDEGKCKMAWDRSQEAPATSEKEEKLETNEKPKTAEAWLNSQADMPPEVRESIQESLATNKTVKGQLVSNIMADSRNTFTKEQLDSKPVSELKALAAFTVQTSGQEEQKPFFGLQASLFTQAKKDNGDKGPEPLRVQSLEEAIREDRKPK